MSWKPKVIERQHPFGEVGVNLSLEEVARRAAKGMIDPRVRTWAIGILDHARARGERVSRPGDRARILLRAVQQKLWVPDPVGTEYIPGAHLLACDFEQEKEGKVCVTGGDCDDLVVLLASGFSSVGLYTMIVGHSLSGDRAIEHVLTAVYVNRRWHYADPSTDLPLGECVPFTRERLLSMPNVQVLCDKNSCLRDNRFEPESSGFVEHGTFVGVDGIPESLDGLSSDLFWLGEVPQLELTWLGETPTPAQPNGRLTMIELLTASGVIISALSLGINLWATRKRLAMLENSGADVEE